MDLAPLENKICISIFTFSSAVFEENDEVLS